MRFSAAKKNIPSLLLIFLLFTALFLSSCTTNLKKTSGQKLRPSVEKGYIEFYCMRCMTGWAVFKKDGKKQISLAQKLLGRNVKDSVEAPSREKKVRISLPVGPHEVTIRLLPYALEDMDFHVKDGSAKEVRIMVDQNRLTPVRVDFTRINNHSFSWSVKQGDPIPLSENANTIETHTIYLNSANWDTRWYATQFFGQMKGKMPKLALARLGKLAGWGALQKCLKKATIVECESLREKATMILKKIERKRP